MILIFHSQEDYVEDGVTTLTDFTAAIIGQELFSSIKESNQNIKEVLICGGGRKK